jgi:hypothetical protein
LAASIIKAGARCLFSRTTQIWRPERQCPAAGVERTLLVFDVRRLRCDEMASSAIDGRANRASTPPRAHPRAPVVTRPRRQGDRVATKPCARGFARNGTLLAAFLGYRRPWTEGNPHEKNSRDCDAGPVAYFFRGNGTGAWRRRRARGIVRRFGVGADRRRGRCGRRLYRWAIDRPFVGLETVRHRPPGRKIRQAGGSLIAWQRSASAEQPGRSATGGKSAAAFS